MAKIGVKIISCDNVEIIPVGENGVMNGIINSEKINRPSDNIFANIIIGIIITEKYNASLMADCFSLKYRRYVIDANRNNIPLCLNKKAIDREIAVYAM